MTARLHSPHHHGRLALAAGAGVLGGAAAVGLGRPIGLGVLIGWNLACLVFLPLTWRLFSADEATVRAHAGIEDQGAPIMTALVMGAVAASIGATVFALNESKGGGSRLWPLGLSVSTLVMSWLVIQTVFALRYAHAYFGDGNRDGSIDGGVKFPGEPPSDYRAFIYMAVCIGSTFQVSDFNILTNDYRSLVTTHAVISFAFNVAVLALGVNMVAAVIGQ
jgi:uncharacterized membrane protein